MITSLRRSTLALGALVIACADDARPNLPALDAATGADVPIAAPDVVATPLERDAPLELDATRDLGPEALLADALDVPAVLDVDMAGDHAAAGADASRCLALQPPTKLYESWCPGTPGSTRLCFQEDRIPL